MTRVRFGFVGAVAACVAVLAVRNANEWWLTALNMAVYASISTAVCVAVTSHVYRPFATGFAAFGGLHHLNYIDGGFYPLAALSAADILSLCAWGVLSAANVPAPIGESNGWLEDAFENVWTGNVLHVSHHLWTFFLATLAGCVVHYVYKRSKRRATP